MHGVVCHRAAAPYGDDDPLCRAKRFRKKMAYRRVAAPYGDYRSPIHLSLDLHKYPVYI